MPELERAPSFASAYLRRWADPRDPHDRACPCFGCADARQYIGLPPLGGALAPETPEEVDRRRRR